MSLIQTKEQQECSKLSPFWSKPAHPNFRRKQPPQVSLRGRVKIKRSFCTSTFSCLFLPWPQVTDGFHLIKYTVILPRSPITVTTSSAQILPPGCKLLAILEGFSFHFNVRAELREGIKHTERNKQLKRLFIFQARAWYEWAALNSPSNEGGFQPVTGVLPCCSDTQKNKYP